MKALVAPAFLLALASPAVAETRPPLPVRTIHVEITDPGDPSGGVDLVTSLQGDQSCASVTVVEGPNRRKLGLCASGSADKPFLELRLERSATAGRSVDVTFGATAPRGQRTQLGKVTLGPKQTLEAHATVTTSD